MAISDIRTLTAPKKPPKNVPHVDLVPESRSILAAGCWDVQPEILQHRIASANHHKHAATGIAQIRRTHAMCAGFSTRKTLEKSAPSNNTISTNKPSLRQQYKRLALGRVRQLQWGGRDRRHPRASEWGRAGTGPGLGNAVAIEF